MTFAEIAALVTARFPAVVAENATTPWLRVPAAELAAVAAFVRDEPEIRCNSLMNLSGVDLLKLPGANGEIAVVYHLHSLKHRHPLTLKVLLPREAPEVATVSQLWPVALFFEREVFDLYGVRFAGHPDLRRLLMPEDWQGHPLRKDYTYPTAYAGVAHEREGQKFVGRT